VLSGVENFQGYLSTSGAFPPDKRYGLQDRATTYGWEEVDARFDARGAGHENEPNRFGWIVELDPFSPSFSPDEPPAKHTALGRFKHEGANVIVGRFGHVAAHMGDDERFDYVYEFVSKNRMRSGTGPSARAMNKMLLSRGSLSVARFTGNSPVDQMDGSGKPARRRRLRRHRGVAADRRRRGQPGARVQRRAGAGVLPAGRRPARRDQDGPARGRPTEPAHRQGLRGLHEQHRSWQGRRERGCHRGESAHPEP